MLSGVTIHVSSFINIDSDTQKLMGGFTDDTMTTWKSHKPALISSKYGKRARNSLVSMEEAQL
jgi:hypothetical protein